MSENTASTPAPEVPVRVAEHYWVMDKGVWSPCGRETFIDYRCRHLQCAAWVPADAHSMEVYFRGSPREYRVVAELMAAAQAGQAPQPFTSPLRQRALNFALEHGFGSHIPDANAPRSEWAVFFLQASAMFKGLENGARAEVWRKRTPESKGAARAQVEYNEEQHARCIQFIREFEKDPVP